MEMENHKHNLDKEYEALLTQFSKELEKLRQVSLLSPCMPNPFGASSASWKFATQHFPGV